MSQIRGIYAAGMSILDENLTLNVDKTIEHSESLIDRGCHGVAVFGSTGQAQLISISEKIEKCSESTGIKVVLFFLNSFLINGHPQTIASLFAIAINLVRLIILYVGNNPPIPEIALIT